MVATVVIGTVVAGTVVTGTVVAGASEVGEAIVDEAVDEQIGSRTTGMEGSHQAAFERPVGAAQNRMESRADRRQVAAVPQNDLELAQRMAKVEGASERLLRSHSTDRCVARLERSIDSLPQELVERQYLGLEAAVAGEAACQGQERLEVLPVLGYQPDPGHRSLRGADRPRSWRIDCCG